MFIHVFLGTLSKQYKGNFILPNFEKAAEKSRLVQIQQ